LYFTQADGQGQNKMGIAKTLAAGTIYKTSDLSSFKSSDEQRPVNPYHLKRLTESIQKKNLLPDFPILIDQSGRVIDGQHRLAVAKNLGLEIYFKHATVTDFEDVGFANSNVKKWGMQDYLHYWCEKNVADYLRLRDFLTTYGYMRLSDVAQLMSGVAVNESSGRSTSGHSTSGKLNTWRRAFESGEWEIVDFASALTITRAAKDFEPYYTGWKRAKFVRAVQRLFEDPRYDHKRMLHQLKRYAGGKMHHCTRMDEYQDILASIYNHKRRTYVVEDIGRPN
jgi:hypothetical protein